MKHLTIAHIIGVVFAALGATATIPVAAADAAVDAPTVAKDAKKAPQAPAGPGRVEAAYRRYADILDTMANLTQERPGVVHAEAIGQTVRGRPIWAFTVSNPASTVTTRVLVTANIHAMEWIGTEVAVDLLEDLVMAPVDGVEVTVIPVWNVDGREKVETDLNEGLNAYRRTNANGVDLNRDFAVNRDATAIWRHILPARYTTSPAPLSQPETQAVDALAKRVQYDVSIDLHAFGGYIYYPWAGLWERPPDRDQFVALGHVMEHGQGARAYRTAQLSHWAFFFRGHGMAIDHLYQEYGTKAFLIELTRSGYSIAHPADWKNHFRMYNPVDPTADRERGVGGIQALLHYLAAPDHWPGGPPKPPTKVLPPR